MSELPSRVLALDVGSVRIGVAVTDAGRRLAFPRGSVPFTSPTQVLESLSKLLGEAWTEVNLIIIGLPVSLDGDIGEGATQVRNWGEELALVSQKMVLYSDERFSTVEAWRRLHEAGKSTRRGKTAIDGAAAAVILEGWLERSI